MSKISEIHKLPYTVASGIRKGLITRKSCRMLLTGGKGYAAEIGFSNAFDLALRGYIKRAKTKK